MNDEDFALTLGAGAGSLFPYSNTLAANVTGHIGYGAVDVGYDYLRSPDYKVGVYVGYFDFHQFMNAFGIVPLVGINGIPPTPSNGAPSITQNNNWSALRIGNAAEVMLTERLKFSGDVAYLPYASLSAVDQHFFGNSGVLSTNNPEGGHGQGVQAEAVLSYYVTPAWSLGFGARYWGLWTTSAQRTTNFDATFRRSRHDRSVGQQVVRRATRRIRAGRLQVRRVSRASRIGLNGVLLSWSRYIESMREFRDVT